MEFYEAVSSGEFHTALNEAWGAYTGSPWPVASPSKDYKTFEAGYISAFLHGPGGKPVAALLAGDHEHILAGLTRPVFMLNIIAFYKHFGLKAATRDEGKQDEPDHLASMLELMSVLCHLEARALAEGKDETGYQRAQRDFLCRYLGPTLNTVAGLLRRSPVETLDSTVAQLVQDICVWSDVQINELEVRVGPFRDPDAPQPSRIPVEQPAQSLWD
ncbi:MAG: molecular chaperone TorD family protein [Paracoccaceae bacterium]|nr:molecular chaperone TorD family protein [Paracoccaceae bacterium]